MKNFFLGGFLGITLLICVLATCVFFCFASIFGAFTTTFGNLEGQQNQANTQQEKFLYGDESSTNKILVINIDGIIMNEAPSDSLSSFLSTGIVYGYEIKSQLINAANADTVSAILLKINSPGGTITGSKAIADGVEYYKEKTGKKVYGFGSGLVASGGYWSIASTDKVFLDYGSVIGSIGVISGEIVYYNTLLASGDALTKEGIEVEYITAGEGKDTGSPFRRITDEERAIMQQSADDAYDVFVSFVSDMRDIDKSKIVNEIGAHVYGEDQALTIDLIDQIASREETFESIASELNLSDFKFFEYKNDAGFLGTLFGLSENLSQLKVSPVCNMLKQQLAIYGDPVQVCNF